MTYQKFLIILNLFADDINLIFYEKIILNLKDKIRYNKLFKWL